jgi:hypothetical protein
MNGRKRGGHGSPWQKNKIKNSLATARSVKNGAALVGEGAFGQVNNSGKNSRGGMRVAGKRESEKEDGPFRVEKGDGMEK